MQYYFPPSPTYSDTSSDSLSSSPDSTPMMLSRSVEETCFIPPLPSSSRPTFPQPKSILRTRSASVVHRPRPLPNVPHKLLCKSCNACITNISLSCDHSRKFRGFSGRAELFNEVYNATLAPPRVQLMVSGAHTMQNISCSSCETFLGWKIVRAHDTTEKWKEGRCLLEMEHLYETGMGRDSI